jgi:hypothetical protein
MAVGLVELMYRTKGEGNEGREENMEATKETCTADEDEWLRSTGVDYQF